MSGTDSAAVAAAASEVCVYYVIIVGREAPLYKYIVEYIQQKQKADLGPLASPHAGPHGVPDCLNA